MGLIDHVVGAGGSDKAQKSTGPNKGQQDLIDFLKQYQKPEDALRGLQIAMDLYPAMRTIIAGAISALERGEPPKEVMKKISGTAGAKSA